MPHKHDQTGHFYLIQESSHKYPSIDASSFQRAVLHAELLHKHPALPSSFEYLEFSYHNLFSFPIRQFLAHVSTDPIQPFSLPY